MPENPYLMDEKNIPSNWQPIDAPTPGTGAPAPPVPHDMPAYFSGSLAPQLQLDSAFSSTAQASPRIPKSSLMPFGNQASAFTNAAAQSTATILISQIPAAPPAPPAATAVTDGLIHEDAIWWIDPAYFLIREDFAMTSPGASILNDFIGQVPWHGVNGGPGAFPSILNPGGTLGTAPPGFGFVTMTGSGNASDISWLIPRTGIASNPQNGWALLDYPGWKMIWVFAVGRQDAGSVAPAFSWTQVSTYIGLGNWPGINAENGVTTTARPLDFVGLRYDTDTTAPAISDTQFMFEVVFQAPTNAAPVRNNTQGTTFATGINATEGKTYRLEISCLASGQIKFFLTDGTTTSTTTMSISKLSIATAPSVRIDNNIALYTSGGGLNYPWNNGTVVTIAGGSVSIFNGTFTMSPGFWQPNNGSWYLVGTQSPTTDTGATTSFYPALMPFVAFGNDTVASPTAGSKGIQVDFFSIVWNKGLAGATSASSTLARGW